MLLSSFNPIFADHSNYCGSDSEHGAWGGNGGWWGGGNSDWYGDRGWPNYRYDADCSCPCHHYIHPYYHPSCYESQNHNPTPYPYNDTVPGAGLYLEIKE